MMKQETLEQQMIRHEGLELYPYDDHDGKRVGRGYKQEIEGHLTIGVGLNLEAGLTKQEAIMLLRMRLDRVSVKLRHAIPFFERLGYLRREVLINMAYNMGITGLLGFKRMLASLAENDFELAAHEMLDSRWADQVGGRAYDLAKQMKTG